MKILHTADLHLGKALNERPLLDLQEEMLGGLLEAVEKHGVQGVLLAGDIYDRSLPPKEAVELLSRFLSELCLQRGVKVVMVSGNHDSPERLSYAADLLSGMGLHIGLVDKAITRVELGGVDVYALPYVDRTHLSYLHEKKFKSLEEAVSHHLNALELSADRYNILMSHHYVLGESPLEESDSERPLFLGNTENLSAGLFKSFDYVALGHIHKAQSVAENIRYSGAPMKYSKSEAHREPGYIILDTEERTTAFYPLRLSKDLLVYRGLFHELMEGESQDLCYFELEDTSPLPDAMNRLKQRYPEGLGLSYVRMTSQLKTKSGEEIQSLDHLTLFSNFYLESTGHPLKEEDLSLVRDMLERSSRETD